MIDYFWTGGFSPLVAMGGACTLAPLEQAHIWLVDMKVVPVGSDICPWDPTLPVGSETLYPTPQKTMDFTVGCGITNFSTPANDECRV